MEKHIDYVISNVSMFYLPACRSCLAEPQRRRRQGSQCDIFEL